MSIHQYPRSIVIPASHSVIPAKHATWKVATFFTWAGIQHSAPRALSFPRRRESSILIRD